MRVKYDGGKEYLKGGMSDPFFNLYLTHLSYRPSCFECPFRTCKRLSDFTIADCWGIEIVNPDFDDNKGCTTFILQSERGKEVFEAIKNKASHIEYGIQNVRQYNKHIENQADKPQDYEAFNQDYKLHGFMSASKRVLRKHNSRGLITRIKGIIKRIIR